MLSALWESQSSEYTGYCHQLLGLGGWRGAGFHLYALPHNDQVGAQVISDVFLGFKLPSRGPLPSEGGIDSPCFHVYEVETRFR